MYFLYKFYLLKENKNDCITLTIKRNAVPDFLYDNQNRQNANVTYANYDVLTNTFNGISLNNGANNSSSNNNNNL